MRLYRVIATCAVAAVGFGVRTLPAQTLTGEAWKLEAKGEAAEARIQLQKAAEDAPNDPLAREAYAQFLAHHRDPAARGEYEKLLQLYSNNGASPAERAKVARRLAELDLMAGGRASAESDSALPAAVTPPQSSFIEIPGPLRSFARMSAISPDIAPEDVMPALAHNITLNGYAAGHSSESLDPTEFLKLVIHYLAQARELEKLA